MCLFPRKLGQPINGLTEFSCGVCPECLARRSRLWALRATMEAKVSPAYMITLTYDNYLRDKSGKIIGELPPDASLHVSKRDCQLFFKRLRRHFPNNKIKYICTAEYGSHTHRAHYHVLLFGIVLNDLIVKGKSKRGNLIYRSPTISRIWANAPANADWRSFPICTVDAVCVGPSVARYCTKYCSKDSGRDGGDDTFMLFSRGIGDSELTRLFNGKSYIIDGREYPVPKQIWNREIEKCYGVSFRYVPRDRDELVSLRFSGNERRRDLSGRFVKNELVFANQYARKQARVARDSHPAYQEYISYWQNKVDEFERTRPSAFDRIRALPDNKYLAYKAACMDYLVSKSPCKCPPRSSDRVVSYRRQKYFAEHLGVGLPSFAVPACHYTANDTDDVLLRFYLRCHVFDYDGNNPFNIVLGRKI